MSLSRRIYVVIMVVTATIAVFATGVAIGQSQRFDDVPPSHYAFDAAEWAVVHGITSGCGDGTRFCPDNTLNRAQVVTFLKRYDDWVLNGRPSPTSGLNAGIGAEAACLYTDRGCPVEKTGTFGIPRDTLLVIGRDIAPGNWYRTGCSYAEVSERIKDHPDYIPPGETWADWRTDLNRVRGYTGYETDDRYDARGYIHDAFPGTITVTDGWAIIFSDSC